MARVFYYNSRLRQNVMSYTMMILGSFSYASEGSVVITLSVDIQLAASIVWLYCRVPSFFS